MAETRKHNPRTSSIGERVREAIGGVPRVTPPDDENPAAGDDPFVTEPEPELDEPPIVGAAADPMGGYTLLAGEQPGLITLGADQLDKLTTVIRTEHASDSENDDEFWDDEDDDL